MLVVDRLMEIKKSLITLQVATFVCYLTGFVFADSHMSKIEVVVGPLVILFWWCAILLIFNLIGGIIDKLSGDRRY